MEGRRFGDDAFETFVDMQGGLQRSEPKIQYMPTNGRKIGSRKLTSGGN